MDHSQRRSPGAKHEETEHLHTFGCKCRLCDPATKKTHHEWQVPCRSSLQALRKVDDDLAGQNQTGCNESAHGCSELGDEESGDERRDRVGEFDRAHKAGKARLARAERVLDGTEIVRCIVTVCGGPP